MEMHLEADWNTREVFFIWPEGIPERDHLTKSVQTLIQLVPPEIRITLITKSVSTERTIQSNLTGNNSNRVTTMVLPDVQDIWIRDWAPAVVNDTVQRILVKAKYKPRYLNGTFRKYALGDDRAGKQLADILGLKKCEIPLVWDLGNLTHNGQGTAIVTCRIMEDNPKYDINGLESILKKYFGIDKLIVIDVEPGDETGHVDGTVRFIDEYIVAVAKYPVKYEEENEWLKHLVTQLKDSLGTDYTIIRIPNGDIESVKHEGIPSAVGNHLNFLRVKDYLFMPFYGISEDDTAVNAIIKACPHINVIPVRGEEVYELAKLGGVFNCFSWGL